MVIGTAGHIDHGKSTLVVALTGTDPDRLKEEKARGITIDLGFAHTAIDGLDVGFVDVPGHERFVRNMLAGVGGIDAVLLVIAADESVMPQTREHFAICRLLHIPSGVIVLTKADLVDAETLELARLEALELVAGSFLEDAPIIPVSARTGAGVDALREALAAIAAAVPARRTEGAPRLPIDRVFSMRGFGTVVTGTLSSGRISVDDDLIVLPRHRAAKVRGIQVYGAARTNVGAGGRVAVNLGGVEVAELMRGDTLTTAGALEPTCRFDAVLDLLPDARPLKHGARVRFHHGTTEVLGRVALGPAKEDRAPSGGAPSGRTPSGGTIYARVRLEGPAVVTRGDRFILRSYSPPLTIGGGRVLDPQPPRTPIRTAAALARFRRLDGTEPGAVLSMIAERGSHGFPSAALVHRTGMQPAEAHALTSRLVASGQVVVAGESLFVAGVASALEERLLATVAEHHRSAPLSEGLPREEGRERVFGRAAAPLFEYVVQRLALAGRLTGRDRLALAGHALSLTPEEAAARETLERVFRDAFLAPPDLVAAAAAAGVGATVADRVSKLLLRQKTLVKVETILFHAEALTRLKQEVVAMKSAAGGARIDVAAFKERYGVSRKYAIPLLEYLDRERITRRVGDARIIL